MLDDDTPVDANLIYNEFSQLTEIKAIRVENELESDARHDFGVWLTAEYANESDVVWSYAYSFELSDKYGPPSAGY